MTFYELEFQLLSLSSTDKVKAIQVLAQSLGDRWQGIEQTANVCGGDARIVRTRIPVWVLVQARNLGISESELLQDYPTLSANDLLNAWAYAASHNVQLHQQSSEYAGIVVAKDDSDKILLAERIHKAVETEASLVGRLVRVKK